MLGMTNYDKLAIDDDELESMLDAWKGTPDAPYLVVRELPKAMTNGKPIMTLIWDDLHPYTLMELLVENPEVRWFGIDDWKKIYLIEEVCQVGCDDGCPAHDLPDDEYQRQRDEGAACGCRWEFYQPDIREITDQPMLPRGEVIYRYSKSA